MKPATKKTTTATSHIASLIYDYVRADQWAIETIVTWLKTKPVGLLEKEIASSFPGIRGTLVHIWDTERYWLSVIKKEPAPQSFRFAGFDGTLEQVFEGIQSTSKELAEFVTNLTEEELCEAIYLDTPWVQGTKARYEFIQHCINHSSYHRGQLITVGHHVGFHDAPMTDFSFYLFMIKQPAH
jgi:uncharacterized damage-inducible protein DinB